MVGRYLCRVCVCVCVLATGRRGLPQLPGFNYASRLANHLQQKHRVCVCVL
jgi:hypothetical protein